MTTQVKHNTRNRVITITLGTIFVLTILLIVVNQLTPVPMAGLARLLISTVGYGEPSDMATIRENITAVYDVEYANEANSKLDIYHPTQAEEALPVVVYIHGGGFVGGDKSALEPFAMSIADAGYVVANVNYALAPQHPYPESILQLNAALDYLAEHIAEYGGDMSQVFIAGNSAGAHLTSQLAAIISNAALADEMSIQPAITLEQLRGVALINGIYNMQTLRETGFPSIELFMWSYTGQRNFEDHKNVDAMSTVNAVTGDYPPVFITAGDVDPLESQTLEMIDVLNAHDVNTTAALFTGTNANLDHDFLLNLDEAISQETFASMLAFFAEHAAPAEE